MRLRRARPEDHAAIGAVTVAAYEGFMTGPEDGYADKLADAAARDREAEVWVAAAERTDEVLGTVTLCPPESPWREIATADEAEFRMLAVSPTAQRQGVGAALLDLVLRRAAEQDCRAVVLSSLADMTAAHRIYARAGFVRDPDRDWSPAPGVDLLAFAKEL